MSKKTPLNQVHRDLGAKMVDFGGWDMPVQYSGIKEEHMAVRQKAGLFDVSHMGEIWVKGPGAFDYMQKIITCDFTDTKIGEIKYGPICYPDGGIVDDMLVYKVEEDAYLLIVNAGNIEKDYDWFTSHVDGEDIQIINESDDYGQVAIQGPLALDILAKVTDTDLEAISYFEFKDGQVAGKDCILSRTGYTGEDGYEIYCQAKDTKALWQALVEAGGDDLLPCGLGARDTLRFEAKLPLYGHEMTEDINPLETGLSHFISLDKGDFIGRQAIADMKEAGRPRKILGFEMLGRGIPRADYRVEKDGQDIGYVTSGTYAPYLEKSLGLMLVKTGSAQVGDEVDIVIRKKKVKAQVVKTPFYRRKK